MTEEKKETSAGAKVPKTSVKNQTEEVNTNLYTALAAFQQEVPAIHKGTEGYGYSYADLATILEVVNPLMAKHNLGFTQLLDGQTLKTIIFHTATGETLESVVEIPQGVTLKGMNDFQVLGSAITYMRRYSLSSILGLVTDTDTDAAGEQTGKKEKEPFKSGSSAVPNPATQKQLDLIKNLKEQKGWSSAEVAKELKMDTHAFFGVMEAKKVIEFLMAAPAKQSPIPIDEGGLTPEEEARMNAEMEAGNA